MATSSHHDDEFENVEDCAIPTAQSKGKQSIQRKRTSTVWEHFDIMNYGQESMHAICKRCKKRLSMTVGGGTGHLRRHVANHLTNEESSSRTQSTLSSRDGALQYHVYSQEKMRKVLAKLIIHGEYPFSVIEDPFLTDALQTGAPQYKSYSRRTLKRDAIKIFNDYRDALKESLRTLDSSISLTSDIWTALDGRSFMCLTAHWIDGNWTLQKRIVAFRQIEFPHSGLQIAEIISDIVDDFGMNLKIISITLDNATNNTSAMSILKARLSPIMEGDLFHSRCACHIINLCVKDGLSATGSCVEKIRGIIKFIQCGGARRQEFKRVCLSMGKSFKKPYHDQQHRWNSTYQMLAYAIEFEAPITYFWSEQCRFEAMSSHDWFNVRQLWKCLEGFYHATNLFSTVYSPTSSCLISQLYELSEIFFQIGSEDTEDEDWADSFFLMQEKFQKYWGEVPPINYLVAIMDPRIRLHGLMILLECYSKNMNMESFDAEQVQNYIYGKLHELYSIYQRAHNTSLAPQQRSHASSSMKWSRVIGARTPQVVSSSLNELQFYLQNNLSTYINNEDMDSLDLLKWWKANAQTWPTLAYMARDLLSIPVSTVASESAFSAGARVLTSKRSSLKAKSVEVCVCLRDWLDAEKRLQGLEMDSADSPSSTETHDTDETQPPDE